MVTGVPALAGFTPSIAMQAISPNQFLGGIFFVCIDMLTCFGCFGCFGCDQNPGVKKAWSFLKHNPAPSICGIIADLPGRLELGTLAQNLRID